MRNSRQRDGIHRGSRPPGNSCRSAKIAPTDPPRSSPPVRRAKRPNDTVAVRADQISEAAEHADIELIADLGYHGADGTVRTPVKRKPGRGLSPRDRRANREHARVRCPGERGFAQLKAFKVLRRVRISPGRITTLARSIHTVIRLRTSLAGV